MAVIPRTRNARPIAALLIVLAGMLGSMMSLHIALSAPLLHENSWSSSAQRLSLHSTTSMGERVKRRGRLHPIPPPELYFATIIVMWNPRNYSQRVTRFQQTLEHLLNTVAGNTTWVVAVELAYGSYPFFLPVSDSLPYSTMRFRLAEDQAMWCKERLINLAIEALPCNYRYIAWVDAEVEFTNLQWVDDARRVLNNHHFAQLFERVNFLGPKKEILSVERSIGKQLASGRIFAQLAKNNSLLPRQHWAQFWHPGYAWAARKDALLQTNGVLDRTFGGADKHMAFSLLGAANKSFSVPAYGRRMGALVKNGSWVRPVPEAYLGNILKWQSKVKRAEIYGFGVVPGTINHFWHGDIRNRGYSARWKIIYAYLLDPNVVFTRNGDGLDVWSRLARKSLRRIVAHHFAKRNEDREAPLPPKVHKPKPPFKKAEILLPLNESKTLDVLFSPTNASDDEEQEQEEEESESPALSSSQDKDDEENFNLEIASEESDDNAGQE